MQASTCEAANDNLRISLMVLDCQLVVRVLDSKQGDFMSTATAPKKGKLKKAGPAGLPDERFWIKYSPHHELPLSVTSSLFLHALAFGLIGLILAGFLSGLFGVKKPAPVQTFALAGGGGGDPNGNGEVNSEAAVPTGKEAVDKPKTTDPAPTIENKDLKPPTAVTEPLVKPNEGSSRLFEEATLSPKNLSDVARQANDRLNAIAKGKAGPGVGGGEGGGEGTGIGNEKGPGSGKGTIATEKRRLRWTMIFRTYSGNDYLKQLQDLGAILATPEGTDEFLVYRELGKRPVIGRKEDVGQLPGLRWIDDRADSVPALALSMGLRFRPPYIVAYFPIKLEEQLRKLEKERFAGDENDIEETVFRIEQRPGGKYVPVVHDLRRRK